MGEEGVVRGWGGGANLSTSLTFPFTALVRWNAFPTVSYHISIYNYFRSFRLLNHPRVNNISATGMFNKNWLRKYIKYTIIRAKHLQIKKTQTLWNRSKHTSNKQTLKTVQLWQCLVGTMIGVYIASNSIPLLQIGFVERMDQKKGQVKIGLVSQWKNGGEHPLLG